MNSKRKTKGQKRRQHDRWSYGIMACLTSVLVVLTTSAFATSADETRNNRTEIDNPKIESSQESVQESLNDKKKNSEPEQKNDKTENTDKKESGEEEGDESYKDIDNFQYNSDIPMPVEHQKYLYELTEEYELDYLKTLALIQHESVFNPNATNETNDYGYFQINQINHVQLSKDLDTPNAPLDPYVNIKWGTFMLSELYERWEDEGYSGEHLDYAVWSSYNRGNVGFMRNGYADAYIKKMKESIASIEKYM